MSGWCREGIRRVSRKSPEGVCKVSYQKERPHMSGGCLEGVWRVFGKCLEDV